MRSSSNMHSSTPYCLQNKAENLGDDIKSGFKDVKKSASNTAEKVQDKAENLGDDIKDATRSGSRKAERAADDVSSDVSGDRIRIE